MEIKTVLEQAIKKSETSWAKKTKIYLFDSQVKNRAAPHSDIALLAGGGTGFADIHKCELLWRSLILCSQIFIGKDMLIPILHPDPFPSP